MQILTAQTHTYVVYKNVNICMEYTGTQYIANGKVESIFNVNKDCQGVEAIFNVHAKWEAIELTDQTALNSNDPERSK